MRTIATEPEVHPGTGRADEPGLLMVRSPTGAERWYPKATFTVAEAGELLGLSRRTAFRKADRGAIPTIELDGQRRVTAAGVDRALFSSEYLGVPEPSAESGAGEIEPLPQPTEVGGDVVADEPDMAELDEYGWPIENGQGAADDWKTLRSAPRRELVAVPITPDWPRQPVECVPETADGFGGGVIVEAAVPRPATAEEIALYEQGLDYTRGPGQFIPYY